MLIVIDSISKDTFEMQLGRDGEEEGEGKEEEMWKEEEKMETEVIICNGRAHFWNLQYISETPMRL